MASKSSKRSTTAAKPAFVKPTRTTLLIVVAGVALAGLVWVVFARTSAASLSTARAEREQAESLSDKLDAELASLGEGKSFGPDEAAGLVAPVEALLPSGGSPTDAVDRIRSAATANGVDIENSSFPSNYTKPEGGRSEAVLSAEATGTLTGMASWLADVREDPQLITTTVNSVTTDAETGRATMSVTFTVWATDQKTWAEGSSQAPGAPGLTPQQAAEANQTTGGN